MANDSLYAFDLQDSQKLIRLIDGKGWRAGSRQPHVEKSRLLALAGSGVPARSGTTLGTATVTVKYLQSALGVVTIQDAGYTIEAYNLSTTSVAPGVYVIIEKLDEEWIVMWEEC